MKIGGILLVIYVLSNIFNVCIFKEDKVSFLVIIVKVIRYKNLKNNLNLKIKRLK